MDSKGINHHTLRPIAGFGLGKVAIFLADFPILVGLPGNPAGGYITGPKTQAARLLISET